MFESSQPQHELIHAQPRYYDIGFGNRDLEAECGFLEYISRNLGRGRLDSFLETCCGPGYHMHHFAAQGVRAYGIDSSSEMVTYAGEKARLYGGESGDATPWGGAMGVDPTPNGTSGALALLADPRDFSLPEAVDLAFSPGRCICYLLRNEEVVAHLVAVAKNLGRGGLYIIEAQHPAWLFGNEKVRRREWASEQDGVSVKVRLGTGKERVDPITQVVDLEIVLEVTEGEEKKIVRDTAPVRAFTYQELRALVKLSGVFDWVATFGDLSITQPLDMSEGSRCMVPVLRCSV